MKIIIDNKFSKIIYGGKDNLINFDVYKGLKTLLSIYVEGYEHTKRYKTRDIKCKSCNFELTTDESYWKCIQCGKDDFTIKRHWNGKIYYIDKNLRFLTGFLESVISFLEEKGFDIILEDIRKNRIKPPIEVIKKLKVWDIRPFMIEDLEKFLLISKVNIIEESNDDFLYFPRGIYKAATNAGKNSFIAAAYLTLESKTLLIVHRKELFNQAYKFFTECGIEVSRFGQGHEELGTFTVAMIRTLKNRSKKLNVKKYLESVECLIVDECHRASANEYKKVISQTNSFARFFVSGTPLDNSSSQAQMDIIGQSGLIVAERTNEFLISKGYSQNPQILMFKYDSLVSDNESYNDEMNRMKYSSSKLHIITKICNEANDQQILIVVEHIDHGEFLMKNLIGINSIVEFVHGNDDQREQKLDRFTKCQTNVLISTMIMKEGINIPNINIGINAFGGKSIITSKQVIGRILRHDGQSDECIWIDFLDEGRILTQHTNERLSLYDKEGFNVHYV